MREVHRHVGHRALHGLHEPDVFVAGVGLAKVTVVGEVGRKQSVQGGPVGGQDGAGDAEGNVHIGVLSFAHALSLLNACNGCQVQRLSRRYDFAMLAEPPPARLDELPPALTDHIGFLGVVLGQRSQQIVRAGPGPLDVRPVQFDYLACLASTGPLPSEHSPI